MRKSLVAIGSMALIGILCTGFAASSALAEEEKPTADLSVSILSKYVWRGLELSKESAVVQPSMSIGYKGFAANFWGNMDTNQDKDMYSQGDTSNWNETDFALSCNGSCSFANYSMGYIYYDLEDGLEDTQEVYAGATLKTLLFPTLTIYRDIDAGPAWYVTFDISHSFALTDKLSLDLGAQVSYYDFENAETAADPGDASNAYNAFHTGLLSASISIPMARYFTITPELYYSFALSSESDNFLKTANDYSDNASVDGDTGFVYGGVILAISF